MIRYPVMFGLLMLAWCASFEIVLAADVASTTVVDFGPLLNQVVVPTAAALLSVLAGWVLLQLRTKLGLQANDVAAGMLEKAMQNGLAFAQAEAERRTDGPITVDMHSQIATAAAAYVVDKAPELLKQLGDTPESLADKLKARIALNTTPAAQSLAVPTDASVVRSIAAFLLVGLLLLGGGGMLTACSSASTAPAVSADVAAKATASLAKVQQTYSEATGLVALYCVAWPAKYPCNDAGAMAAIATAEGLLSTGIAKARNAISVATSADAITLGEKIATDAIAVYTMAVTAVGIGSR